MSLKKISLVFIALATITSCQNTDLDKILTKENIGAATGAIGGAWVGSNVGKGKGNVAAIAAGTLLGGYLGKSVGASLDKADKAYMGSTYQKTLEANKTGQTSNWYNPDSGNSGTFTPARTYQSSGGSYCREFKQTITIDGLAQDAYGNACRQNDGSWKIIK